MQLFCCSYYLSTSLCYVKIPCTKNQKVHVAFNYLTTHVWYIYIYIYIYIYDRNYSSVVHIYITGTLHEATFIWIILSCKLFINARYQKLFRVEIFLVAVDPCM